MRPTLTRIEIFGTSNSTPDPATGRIVNGAAETCSTWPVLTAPNVRDSAGTGRTRWAQRRRTVVHEIVAGPGMSSCAQTALRHVRQTGQSHIQSAAEGPQRRQNAEGRTLIGNLRRFDACDDLGLKRTQRVHHPLLSDRELHSDRIAVRRLLRGPQRDRQKAKDYEGDAHHFLFCIFFWICIVDSLSGLDRRNRPGKTTELIAVTLRVGIALRASKPKSRSDGGA